RAESHIVGVGRERGVELFSAVGADAELDARGSDGVEVGADKVALAEMHEIRAEADRFAPIVVDYELTAMRRSNFERLRDLCLDCGGRRILDAKLNELCALARELRDPGGVGKDRIKRI